MTEAHRTWQASDRRRVAGRYELVGLNGSLLPAEVEDEVEEGSALRAFLVQGELLLALDQSYDLSLTARYAAVTRLSVVHRTRAPWGRRREPDFTWVYIRRSAARRVWGGG